MGSTAWAGPADGTKCVRANTSVCGPGRALQEQVRTDAKTTPLSRGRWPRPLSLSLTCAMLRPDNHRLSTPFHKYANVFQGFRSLKSCERIGWQAISTILS